MRVSLLRLHVCDFMRLGSFEAGLTTFSVSAASGGFIDSYYCLQEKASNRCVDLQQVNMTRRPRRCLPHLRFELIVKVNPEIQVTQFSN